MIIEERAKKERKNSSIMVSFNSILFFLGLISISILIDVSIEASSTPLVKLSGDAGETSGFRQEIAGQESGQESSTSAQLPKETSSVSSSSEENLLDVDEQQTVSQSSTPETINIEDTDLYQDVSFLSLDGENVKKAMDELGLSDKPQSQVTLSHPKLIVRVCAQLSKDIAWSLFKENYS